MRPWADWIARRIDDPVMRLRFLQSVTPLGAVPKRRVSWGWVCLAAAVTVLISGSIVWLRAVSQVNAVAATPPALSVPVTVVNPAGVAKVWLVDKAGNSETYSNGLRVDTSLERANHTRSYVAFPQADGSGNGVRRERPAGLVFHTTESRQAPFDESQNRALKKIGESLLEFVSREHSYNFLIDRFGRVYRLVPETDAANHAGHSVWADETWLYVNLNESFLGVSFETETEPGQAQSTISPAQVRSAAMLTEMLRDRYGIPAGNCVTHAQVSVNPDNMRVGYHTDWASSFPFAELGLPDNYARPLPAILHFGFQYDETFRRWAGTRLYAGVLLADEEIGRRALESGAPVEIVRKRLRQRYRRLLQQR